jgi:transcriptional regulator NrdR family protein
MKCPACLSEKSKVLDTRGFDTCIRRVRECSNCSKVWTTWELSESAILVVNSEPANMPVSLPVSAKNP